LNSSNRKYQNPEYLALPFIDRVFREKMDEIRGTRRKSKIKMKKSK
jgi:hypothetical protein